MEEIKFYIESGNVEAYLLGELTEAETLVFENKLAQFPELAEELVSVANSLEAFSFATEIKPDPTIKPFLWATIDYMQRLEQGEAPSFPPALSAESKVADFSTWLTREDLQLTSELNAFHAKIIGYTPEQITAIVWIEQMAPPEIYDNEIERFLIVEGTCDIQIG